MITIITRRKSKIVLRKKHDFYSNKLSLEGWAGERGEGGGTRQWEPDFETSRSIFFCIYLFFVFIVFFFCVALILILLFFILHCRGWRSRRGGERGERREEKKPKGSGWRKREGRWGSPQRGTHFSFSFQFETTSPFPLVAQVAESLASPGWANYKPQGIAEVVTQNSLYAP